MPITEGHQAAADVHREVDVVVIGTGAGGAVVAATLAEAGARVVVLEEGAYHPTDSFTARSLEMVGRLYRNNGLLSTIGNTLIPIPLGKCVGGTTTINSGTCYPPPDYVLDEWVHTFGLADYAPERFAPYVDEVSERVSVAPVPEELLGPNAERFREGVRKLGFEAAPIPRNVSGCKGTGVCVLGCPTGAKQSMNVSYVPAALDAGAEVITGARAKRVLCDGRRAYGVHADVLDATGRRTGKRLRVLAHKVVVACGALLTPVVLARSGVKHTLLGRNLRIHPAARVGAVFDEKIEGWIGVPQSYHISEFEREGIFIQGQYVPPALEAATLPGVGAEHRALMEKFPYLGSFGALISETTTGRVMPGPGGLPVIWYNLGREDRRRMARAISLTAQCWFAAGAQAVFPSVRTQPQITSMGDAKALALSAPKARDFDLMAFHPMGTARMAADPAKGVTGGAGAVHGYEGLYVADASVLPTSTKRNPQITIMAVATKIARALAAG